jgi:hypothetical protein
LRFDLWFERRLQCLKVIAAVAINTAAGARVYAVFAIAP